MKNILIRVHNCTREEYTDLIDYLEDECWDYVEENTENNSLSFIDDLEKYDDFRALTKEEFLKSYSYLTYAEYEATLQDEKRIYGD